MWDRQGHCGLYFDLVRRLFFGLVIFLKFFPALSES